MKAIYIQWEVIGGLARPQKHLSILGWAIQHLFFLGYRLRLFLGVADPNQVPEGKVPHGVAGCTHLFVHLQTCIEVSIRSEGEPT